MSLDNNIILAIVIGIILLLLVGKVLFLPIKFVFKLIINMVIGGVIIFVINCLGGLIGFQLALNIISALIVGILGVPGIGVLLFMKYFL